MTSEIVPMTASGAIVGLEDVDLNDGGTPRIAIDHPDAKWRDTLSGVAVSEFDGVVLGIVKQRVLWPPEVGDEPSAPLCKSVDFNTGFPDTETFPLEESKTKFVMVGDTATINCGDCALKDWDTHPTRSGPWCGEQHVLPVLADLEGDGNQMPALVTMQRSALKASRQYLGTFARKGQPAFAVNTNFKLTPMKRGSVKYAVPVLSRGEATDPEDWVGYGETYVQIRTFLQTMKSNEESASPSDKAPKSINVDRDEDELEDF